VNVAARLVGDVTRRDNERYAAARLVGDLRSRIHVVLNASSMLIDPARLVGDPRPLGSEPVARLVGDPRPLGRRQDH